VANAEKEVMMGGRRQTVTGKAKLTQDYGDGGKLKTPFNGSMWGTHPVRKAASGAGRYFTSILGDWRQYGLMFRATPRLSDKRVLV
jgi:hypothetical protein